MSLTSAPVLGIDLETCPSYTGAPLRLRQNLHAEVDGVACLGLDCYVKQQHSSIWDMEHAERKYLAMGQHNMMAGGKRVPPLGDETCT